MIDACDLNSSDALVIDTCGCNILVRFSWFACIFSLSFVIEIYGLTPNWD